MSKNIRLSSKYGLNPTIPICFFCFEEKNEVALMGRLADDKEAPHRAIVDEEPCDECRERMKQGIVLMICDGNEMNRRYGWAVVSDEGYKEVFDQEVPKKRAAFITKELWDEIGPTQE